MAWTKTGTIRPVLKTYATLTEAQAAVTSGELADGEACIIIDPTT
jgi:hypothetical protein